MAPLRAASGAMPDGGCWPRAALTCGWCHGRTTQPRAVSSGGSVRLTTQGVVLGGAAHWTGTDACPHCRAQQMLWHRLWRRKGRRRGPLLAWATGVLPMDAELWAARQLAGSGAVPAWAEP